MLPYWLLFLTLSFGALVSLRALPGDAAGLPYGHSNGNWTPLQPVRRGSANGLLLTAAFLLVFLMIGLRFEVGGDWLNYLRLFSRAGYLGFWQQLSSGDPGYQALNWLVVNGGGAFWLVNLFCSGLFVWGLARLVRLQAEPWLALVVAVPYLIIVVAMGYTRQAAALGIVMAGLAAVFRGAGVLKFALYIAFAALFHRTAIVLLPMLLFVFPRSKLADVVMILALSVSLYVLFLQDDIGTLQRNYLEQQYNSQGAAIRIAQVALAALLFLFTRRLLRFADVEAKAWRNFSYAALLMAILLFVLPSSTVVDRLSLYLLPLQMAVLARLPVAVTTPILARFAVVAYSAVVLFVWLNYAVHADYWLPYRTIIDA